MFGEPRVRVPSPAVKGSIIDVKTMIPHPMETGLRRDPNTGETVPRDIIESFVATLNGKEVFRVKLNPAMAANPVIGFSLRADEPGRLLFVWTDGRGRTASAEAVLEVT